MIAFGPVPSRRLGRSVGINNIPPKVCTYACVYCQVGKTTRMQIDREEFYHPYEIYRDVTKKVENAHKEGEPIDYLTFVSDGEPTLDTNLRQEIRVLKSLGLKIAVITNGSLIWRKDVRADLAKADWISLKLDSIWQNTWRKINRPHNDLNLNVILREMQDFSHNFKGKLVTETMLVQGINSDDKLLIEMAEFLAELNPEKAYLAIPTRPPAENWACPPTPKDINHAFQIFAEKFNRVEYLIGYEGNAFAFTGNIERDLLGITSVHPMREDAVSDLLDKADKDWLIVKKMVSQGQIVETEYNGQRFYMRNFNPMNTR